MSTSAVRRRSRNSLRAELPLILWLVVVWGALWGDWSIGNLVFGLLLALLVTRLLTLPPVRLSGRFNVVHFALFVPTFIWQVAKASFHVSWLAVTQGPRVCNAVLGVPLRQNNDLLMTAVGHTMALIPGSLVVEVTAATGSSTSTCWTSPRPSRRRRSGAPHWTSRPPGSASWAPGRT